MKELMRTTNPALISFVEVLLRDGYIEALVLDQNASVLEGSIGILPKRVMVRDEDYRRACQIIHDADLGHELSDRNE